MRATQALQQATSELAAPKSSAGIAASAKQLAALVPTLAEAACNAACTTNDARSQDRIINLSKDLAEAEHELLGSSALVAGDPKSAAHREKSVAAAARATAAIALLMKQLQAEVDLLSDLDNSLATIRAALPTLDTAADKAVPYGSAKATINAQARVLGQSARALVVVDKKNIAQIGHSSTQIAKALPQLIDAAKSAAASTDDRQVQNDVLQQTRALAKACEQIVVSAKACAIDAGDTAALTKMTNNTKLATDSISQLLAAAKKGDMAAYACDEAVAKVTRNIGQLDAAALYAAAGQLEPEAGNDNFGKAQQQLIASSQAMLGDAKALAQSTKQSPAALGECAKRLGDRSDQLVVAAKSSASLVDNNDTQQSLLHGGKVVLVASAQVIEAALAVQQTPGDAALVAEAQKSSQALNGAVDALGRALTAAADEQSRGARDLDEAAQAIERSLVGFDQHGNPKASAEDVVVSCRGIAG